MERKPLASGNGGTVLDNHDIVLSKFYALSVFNDAASIKGEMALRTILFVMNEEFFASDDALADVYELAPQRLV